MIKCIIVEDEVLAQNVIQSHLKQFANFELVAVCSNTFAAEKVLLEQSIDLIFLDIQLPGNTGINFLKSLPAPPLTIITTAYAEYAAESYELNVIDYLLKPISLERFAKALAKINEEKLFTQPAKENTLLQEHIFIKANSKFFKINFSEIVYIQGMKDYLKIYTTDFKLVTHQTMSEMEKLLPPRMFMRVHKSYIISLASIKTFSGNSAELSNNTIIPVGNLYKQNLLHFINSRK